MTHLDFIITERPPEAHLDFLGLDWRAEKNGKNVTQFC
jgi:hypothetical protein